MKKKISVVLVSVLCVLFCVGADDCVESAAPQATSGVSKATAQVKTQANGLTVEQTNVKRRLELENTPGMVQHLYIISAYSGQVLLYSTVKGKVTSSGKRLTPVTVAAQDGQYVDGRHEGFGVDFNGVTRNTGEVLQDDGTYGSSIEYLFWWDVKGVYRQQYITGGMMVHISDQPTSFGRVTLNVEGTK